MKIERCYPVHSVALVGLIHMGDIKSRAHARGQYLSRHWRFQ
jgi:hypothetical protein